MMPPANRKPVTLSDKVLAERCANGRVVVIDDDVDFLAAIASLIELEGYACETYPSALAYLQALTYNRPCFAGPCCVLCDVRMPEVDGLDLQRRLASLDDVPLLLMSGASGVEEAISGFRGGALDFLLKPIDADTLLAAVAKALAISRERQEQTHRRADVAERISSLTGREREVTVRVAAGLTNQSIADELVISLRSVKRLRQSAMGKLGAAGMPDLVRIMADESGSKCP